MADRLIPLRSDGTLPPLAVAAIKQFVSTQFTGNGPVHVDVDPNTKQVAISLAAGSAGLALTDVKAALSGVGGVTIDQDPNSSAIILGLNNIAIGKITGLSAALSAKAPIVETPFVANATATATAVPDIVTSRFSEITLTAAVCPIVLAAAPAGVSAIGVMIIHQDATGGRAISWPNTITWAGGTPPTLATSANAFTTVTLIYSNGQIIGYPASAVASGGGGGSSSSGDVAAETQRAQTAEQLNASSIALAGLPDEAVGSTRTTLNTGVTSVVSVAGTYVAPAVQQAVSSPPQRFAINNRFTGPVTLSIPSSTGSALSITILPGESRTYRQGTTSGYSLESGVPLSQLDLRFGGASSFSRLASVRPTAISPGIVNTTTETPMFSMTIPAAQVAAGDSLDLRATWDFINNTGAVSSFIYILYLDGVAIATTTGINSANGTQRGSGSLDARISIVSLTEQRGKALLDVTSSPGSGSTVTWRPSSPYVANFVSGADLSSDRIITLTAKMNNASTLADVRLYAASLDRSR